jgi:hypothetical protein
MRRFGILLSAIYLVAGSFIYFDYERSVERERAVVSSMAKFAADHFRSTTSQVGTTLEIVRDIVRTSDGALEVGSAANAKEVRQLASAIKGCEGIWFLDKVGRTVLTTSLSQDPLNFSDAERAMFTELTMRKGLVISPATRRIFGGKLIYTISLPIYAKDGAFESVVIAAMNVEVLTDFYSMMPLSDDALVGIYRLDGEIVARHPNLEIFVGSNISNAPIFAEAKGALAGTHISRSPLDKIQRLGGYQVIPEYKIISYVGLRLESALIDWQTRSLQIVICLFIITIFGLIRVIFVFRPELLDVRSQGE